MPGSTAEAGATRPSGSRKVCVASRLKMVTAADIEVPWTIAEIFSGREFSLVDRTSFAMTQRLGIATAAGFDDDFAIYRYGRACDRAFEVLR